MTERTEIWGEVVRTLLTAGLGVEDIAVKLSVAGVKTTAAEVRREVEIYRHEGRIKEIVRGRK